MHELAQTSRSLHVLFNNNYQDVGVRNARQLASLLGDSIVRPYPELADGGPLRPRQGDLFADDEETP
ncbi:MAG: hypothetical protein ACLQUT_03320 [Thermoleophilia bacterium]